MKDARPCSIAATLALVGEKYSLLVLREVSLGATRFDQLVRNTGAPRDVLTTRLKRLVDAGVLEKVQYSERPRRYEYRATAAGLELEPVLLTLMAWGDRHLQEDGARPMVLEHTCGHELVPQVVCRECGEQVDHHTLTPHPQSPGWTVTGPAVA
ncbi:MULTISPECIES: helix-turn-helix domain-containing protein [unclassified Streptomyces]|uniref:winged helix-turn-helix transcriptional regulator n=1 Tax=unclassified Streptomyces TaxID=2593676 RepID=UPI0013BDCC6A|nr:MULTISPECIES: helix-turn-helix domain-containing protein [unclassified Streptomyces]MCX4913348.1 helix-turn-helix transcriptional regulator [Streptomyces sp. NBC_00687]MCX5281933.1 helix-turn-helix transcriptional regulator [Streptomyces sp. NBC_00198]NEB33968.1 helix-turn-helix transcriptional regulator [Streptomyces sp. SID14446]WSD80991.1 helix-turn-helix transcriptional regulator [Streptomyces sp. NBC_01558]